MDSSELHPADHGLFGDLEPISVYTRQQAIEDGVLIDVSECAREAGFRVPVAVTAAAFGDGVAWNEEDNHRQKTIQDEEGRLWDLLYMAHLAATRNPNATEALLYQVYRVPRGGKARKPRMAIYKLALHEGDRGEPVMTVMMPNED